MSATAPTASPPPMSRDVARLYRLALEKGKPGAIFHAVDEEHVPMRAMAEAIGERLGLPARSLAAGGGRRLLRPVRHVRRHGQPRLQRHHPRTLGWTPKERGIVDDLRECEPDGPVILAQTSEPAHLGPGLERVAAGAPLVDRGGLVAIAQRHAAEDHVVVRHAQEAGHGLAGSGPRTPGRRCRGRARRPAASPTA